MGKFLDDLYKFAWFLLVVSFLITFLLLSMYRGAYSLIDNVDSSIYARYATNEKFEENIFFNEKIEKDTGIIEQLEREIDDFIGVSRIQEFAYVITENQNEVEDIISNNEKYQTYLINIGSSVDELIDWSEKTVAIDDKILMGCLYLTFLFISIIMVIPFGFRKTFYVCAGVIYTIAMLSMFTDGISDYLVANVLAFLARLSSDVFTYRDIEQWNLIINQAFKESTLTFIIFDTVVQIYQNNKKERVKNALIYIFCSIDSQCSYLEQFQSDTDAYIAKIILPVDFLVQYCIKKMKIYKRKMTNKRLSEIKKDALYVQYGYYEQLKEKLIFLRYNNSKRYTTKEYIFHLRQIQWLMHKCDIWQSI